MGVYIRGVKLPDTVLFIDVANDNKVYYFDTDGDEITLKAIEIPDNSMIIVPKKEVKNEIQKKAGNS